ncbi:TetR/AcrR family transcriptional regulator [Dyella acidiphila]|uniref:TetR/AcrR family transcriptional regulator n=1 Tax=Dyella acidiphila TaxID=2775866 RepID=A0ABR9G9V6_9GAMM|nr:TetR/AcrR family transcriptional regulator [Dyella acidiphila]MBE1160843.1 TetR/AcrR family transcriptional regulator [Dyella acidiphila]
MRYEKGHKEATRSRIVDTAAQRFREQGIAAVGVAHLMGEVGLTQGGFYNHFASKEELAREALALGLERMRERTRKASAKSGAARIEDLVDSYLSAAHRDNVGRGCMLTTLVIEAGRSDGAVRTQLSDGIKEMVQLIGLVLPESVAPAQREARAMAVVSGLVGCMILARATDDAQMSDRILDAGRRAAIVTANAAF